jgi:putative transposase
MNTLTPKPGAARRSGSSRRSVVPYNPELHALVAGKQAWAEPLSEAEKTRGFLGWHQRGYLPHRDSPGLVQFVTFRLADALPGSRRAEWVALLKIETNRERRLKLEEYLDRGLGQCWLGRPEIAGMVEGALRFFDGVRYQLRAWVVMPNHVHVLLETLSDPLAKVIQSWKSFTAKEANRRLGRTGVFWEREYWDTWMRDQAQERKAVRYLEGNPVKAHLVAEPAAWRWSSARLRDGYGVLKCSDTENRAQPGAPGAGGAPSYTRLGAATPAPSRLQTGAPSGSRVQTGAPKE